MKVGDLFEYTGETNPFYRKGEVYEVLETDAYGGVRMSNKRGSHSWGPNAHAIRFRPVAADVAADVTPDMAECFGCGRFNPRGDECPVCATAGLADEPVKTLLDEAKAIVSGARRSAYGTPERNFDRIALFWNAYFAATGRDVELTAADVSPMMRLMKEARLCESPDHRDSFVDLIGYTLTGAEVNGVEKIPT